MLVNYIPIITLRTRCHESWEHPALSKLDNILYFPKLFQDGDAATPCCWSGSVSRVVAVPASIEHTTILIIKICLQWYDIKWRNDSWKGANMLGKFGQNVRHKMILLESRWCQSAESIVIFSSIEDFFWCKISRITATRQRIVSIALRPTVHLTED